MQPDPRVSLAAVGLGGLCLFAAGVTGGVAQALEAAVFGEGGGDGGSVGLAEGRPVAGQDKGSGLQILLVWGYLT